MLLSENRELLESSDEIKRTDKEVAGDFEKRADLGLAGLHPSVIGKARKLISKWRKQTEAWKERRCSEEYLPILEWLDETRRAATTSDDPGG